MGGRGRSAALGAAFDAAAKGYHVSSAGARTVRPVPVRDDLSPRAAVDAYLAAHGGNLPALTPERRAALTRYVAHMQCGRLRNVHYRHWRSHLARAI